jgi:hypothetical protein
MIRRHSQGLRPPERPASALALALSEALERQKNQQNENDHGPR